MLCLPHPLYAQINLLYTQLTKGSGELVWYPNTQLQQMALINISRSGPRWEGHTWLVDIDTPDEVREQTGGGKLGCKSSSTC